MENSLGKAKSNTNSNERVEAGIYVTNIDIQDDITNTSVAYNNISQNEEMYFYYFYRTEQMTFLWVIFTMIVVANSSVIGGLIMSKNRKTRMNFFIMQLAIADLSVGLINVLTDIIWRMTVHFYGGNIICKFIRFMQVLVTYSSTFVLVAMSIDRYDAITHPMNFTGSWRRSRLLVVSAWCLSAVLSTPALFINKETVVAGHTQCWINLEPWQWQMYMTLVAVSLFFIPALIISACYSVIVYTIWTKSQIMGYPKVAKTSNDRNVATRNSSFTDQERKRASSRGIIPRAKIKTVKMTFVIVIVFILCWSPYIIYDLLQVYGFIPESQTSIAVSTFIQSLASLNSAANPIIYCLFSTKLCRNTGKLSFCNLMSSKLSFLCPSERHPEYRNKSSSRMSKFNTNTTKSTTTTTSSLQRFSGKSKISVNVFRKRGCERGNICMNPLQGELEANTDLRGNTFDEN